MIKALKFNSIQQALGLLMIVICTQEAPAIVWQEGVHHYPVSRFSRGISCMESRITPVNDSVDVELILRKGDTTHRALFTCGPDEAFPAKLVCFSVHGDFLLSGTPKRPRLEFNYINLGPHAPGVELTEEFALQLQPASSAADGGHGHQHAEVASVFGRPEGCPN